MKVEITDLLREQLGDDILTQFSVHCGDHVDAKLVREMYKVREAFNNVRYAKSELIKRIDK